VISAGPIRNHKAGVLVWGVRADSQPFAGGTLCVHAPVKRVPLLDSGGSANGDDCSGAYVPTALARRDAGARLDARHPSVHAVLSRDPASRLRRPGAFGRALFGRA
jgi:hypothetical protein